MGSNTINVKEFNNVVKKIKKWYSKKTKVLSIRTRPFNTSEIFFDVIENIIEENGRVLYVFGSDEEKYVNKKGSKIYNCIEKKINVRLNDKYIKFLSIDSLKDIKEGYDLIIFDDVSLFSKVSNDHLRDAVEEIYWRSNKIIVYSGEYIFPIGEKIDLMYLVAPIPIIEPRLMNTRIKLDDNIPMTLFEYFKWFKENKQVVLIVVPNEEKLNRVYNHYYEVLRELSIRVVRFSRNQDSSFIKEIIGGYSETLFIITNSCGQYINEIKKLNIIMLFSDDVFYSYKKIAYMCGAVDNNREMPQEVIMVCRDVTEDIDKARSLTRKYNRSLWEKHYIKS